MRARSIVLLGAGAVVPLALFASSCGDDGPGDTARFCQEVEDNAAALTSNPETLEDVDDFLDLYRKIGGVAPLAIESHWQALIRNYETASTVEPLDPESRQAALAQAYASEESAVAVRDFLLTHCNVDLGPITTVVPHASTPPSAGAPTPPTTSPG